VSGGADSLALLVLARAQGLEVTAIHVDHGLRPGSADEADLVATAAERFGADFRAEKVTVAPGPNLEARARAARYGVLPQDSLLGHTADDQAETVVLALLRGSAWHGLSGMRPSDRRPIIALRRRDTEALCRVLGLRPVDDESNRDPTHLRNRVRHEVLPLLNEVADRDLVPVLVRQADLIRDGADLLAALASEIDPTDADAMAAAPPVLARQAARDWIWATTGEDHPPDLATVDRVLAVARLEARATDVGRGWRVTRSNRRLRLEPPD
jgi:tRNA(Ile)-lysidine synthase